MQLNTLRATSPGTLSSNLEEEVSIVIDEETTDEKFWDKFATK